MSLTAAFDALATRHVLLFGGKGGVGKTTISCAAALHYAESRRTILFTTDPASNLSDIFTGPTPNLTIEALDADQLYKRFLEKNLPYFLELGDRGTYLDKDELRSFFELALPGVDELMAWMRIGELAEENRDAMLIVDTAPTGHTLRMVNAANHFRQLSVALETMQQKHREIVRRLARRNMRDAIDDFLEDFEAKAERRRALLTDPAQSSFVPVMLSENWVVEQTKRLIADLRGESLDVPMVILNRAAHDCDCERCRQAESRDAEARKAFAEVVDAPRACFPLDTPEEIRNWLVAGRRSEVGKATGLSLPTTDSLPATRLMFLAGKGGVGKTTCSASIALQLAQRHPEKRFTVISVDPAHSLRDVFATQKPPANLAVEAIDTREKWRRFRDSIGQQIERAVGALTPAGMTVVYDSDAIRQLIEIAPPGADELFAIDRLSDLIADESQAGIVVDTAPTGHFLRLLDLPTTAAEWLREFMRILLRYREVVPAGSLGEELVRASRALHSLEAALRSADCEVIVVTRPERVVVQETRRLIADVEKRKMRVGGVIANYVTPETDCSCDRSMRGYEAEALAGLGREAVIIERRDAPVTALPDLAKLVPLDSRA